MKNNFSQQLPQANKKALKSFFKELCNSKNEGRKRGEKMTFPF